MSEFTKHMLIPGLHIVELRDKERFLVWKSPGNGIGFINSQKYFDDIDNYTNDLRFVSDIKGAMDRLDVMRVFTISEFAPINVLVTNERRFLVEVWHREELLITQDEKAILKAIIEVEKYKYITRDKDGELDLFYLEPVKKNDLWCVGSKITEDSPYSLDLFRHKFKFVKWEDEEPWLISDVLSLPVKDGAE